MECQKAWVHKAALFDPRGPVTFSQYYRQSKRDECFKEWLVVVYMAADNDLSPYSWRDLWEMESVGSSLSVDTVVFRDGEEEGMSYWYVSRNVTPIDYFGRLKATVQEMQWESLSEEDQEARFLAREGQSLLVSVQVKRLKEGSSANLATAGDFLRWAFHHFPSRRVLLVGWSHGEGFDARSKPPKASTLGKQGGFAFDEHCEKNVPCDEHMHVTEMASGMKELLKEYRGGKPIDILGSDACLNQQLEFAYEWRGVADYVFGSSTIVQKKGFNYRTFLRYLVDRPTASTDKVAAVIPRLYESSVNPKSHSRYSSYFDEQATMATWTVAELSRLVFALDDVGRDLLAFLEGAKTKAERIARRQFLLDLMGVGGETQASWRSEKLLAPIRLGGVSMDLFNWLQALGAWYRLENDTQKIAHVNEARAVLFGSVLGYFVGPKYLSGLIKTSLGVAIWAPNTESDLKAMWPKLIKGSFYQESLRAGGWAKFMQAMK